MTPPSPTLILYPLFAMFALVAAVLLRLRSLRFAAVRRREISLGFFRAYRGDDESEALRVTSRHFSNLFEVPVLFYVVVLMIHVTGQVRWWLVACAWLYVGLRCAHTVVHLGSNDVMVRFSLYATSGVVLAVMWATLLVQLLLAG